MPETPVDARRISNSRKQTALFNTRGLFSEYPGIFLLYQLSIFAEHLIIRQTSQQRRGLA
jgi:hypothetical protein